MSRSAVAGRLFLILSATLSVVPGLPGPVRAQSLERIVIPVGEYRFHALAAGPEDGPLVLLLHGFPETSYAFRHQLRALGSLGFRAVAPDQRGYSPGARPEGVQAYGMGNLVGDVTGMADALGYDRFDLVGHDWGGAVAWVVATRFPRRVRTLTVLSTPHYAALSAGRSAVGSDQAKRSSYFSDFAAPGAEERFLADDAAYLRGIYGDLPSDAVGEYLRVLQDPEALRAALAWYGAAFGPSSAAADSPAQTRVGPVQVPTLYVWSTKDSAFGRESAEATRAFVQGPYRFEVVDGVDHWIAERVPELVNQLIAQHVASQGGGAESSFRAGRAVLLGALEALGGDPATRPGALTASFRGSAYARGQSARPGPPFDRLPVSGSFAFDSQGRVRTALEFRNAGGTDRSYRQVLNGDASWNLWVARDLLSMLDGRDVSRLMDLPIANVALAFPHRLVLDALAAPASIRATGDVAGAGVRTVSFASPSGATTTLSVGSDGLPVRAEWMVSDPRLGDAAQAVEFHDYRVVEGVRIPHRLRFLAGPEEAATWQLSDVSLTDSLGVAELQPPGELSPVAYPPSFQPREVGPGVWSLRLYSGPANSYSVLLVELDDGIVVVEPVLTDLFGPAVRQIAERLAPGKAVTWVVATHHHSDHLGGVRSFLGAGARVVTTPDATKVIRQMSAGRPGIAPNPALGVDLDSALVETDDRYVIGAGDRRVEVIAVDPSLHAAQMLIAWIPHAGTVYVADLFSKPESGVYPHTELTAVLQEALRRLGPGVETIVPTHGLVARPADLLAAQQPTG